MGIKFFFSWFKNNYSHHIKIIKRENRPSEKIDNLMIDLNGIIHNCAQKVYEYGAYKGLNSLTNKRRKESFKERQFVLFKEISSYILKLVFLLRPQKRLIICIDGVAPRGKQNQQRQRRFKASLSMEENFDSNCITPGTKFMDFLSKYLDYFIRSEISNENSDWGKAFDVIFSNEKVPGEGEHNCIDFIRKYNNPKESYCIHGVDADLIMLSLATHLPNFYISREDMYSSGEQYHFIDIGKVRNELAYTLNWKTDPFLNDDQVKNLINDFIFLFFAVGNDFLPHIPNVEILNGGVDQLIDTYKLCCCSSQKYLTTTTNIIEKDTLKQLLLLLSEKEKSYFEKKLFDKECFPDELLQKCKEGESVNLKKYKEDYYNFRLKVDNLEKCCLSYFEGLQWVFTYYTSGVPSWSWFYPYYFAPFASDLVSFIDSYKKIDYGTTYPATPFEQLMCVLPSRSAYLLPEPINSLLTDFNSPIIKFYPKEFEIELALCKKDWEGIPILPVLDLKKIRDIYFSYKDRIDKREAARNTENKTKIYKYSKEKSSTFTSYYGEIKNHKVETILL
jgi:5'-3' exonuclease